MYDLAIIGGGINGVGIARDAAGRGLRVLLLEKSDLGGATSSASSKLVHGGLRYLEHCAFRLVREALKEREVLLGIAPHIIWPMDFLLPAGGGQARPAWMLRAGLFLYDCLAPRGALRRSSRVTLHGDVLKDQFFFGFRYTDCWVDDARLVLANAQDAAARGAEIRTRTACTALVRQGGSWRVTLETGETLAAKAVVNAAGPWVDEVSRLAGVRTRGRTRLVKGSHIVVPRIHKGRHAYLLPLADGRVLFVLPFQDRFSLIGTTDALFSGDPTEVRISEEEIDYLLAAVNSYLLHPLSRADIVWHYAGVRALYDDGRPDASSVTRDYVLERDDGEGAPFLTLFGGKITTYRKLAEAAMEKLLPFFPDTPRANWTHSAALPGGEDYDMAPVLALPPALCGRWQRQYGAKSLDILAAGGIKGEPVAGDVHEAELRHARDHEWARTGEDFLWKRSKLGLIFDAEERARITDWFDKNRK